MSLISLNTAQVTAIASLYTLGPVWARFPTRWIDILDSRDAGEEFYVVRVKVQIASSLLKGEVVLERRMNKCWTLAGMRSHLDLTGGGGGVVFGINEETGMLIAKSI
jgi:hypothetical protein